MTLDPEESGTKCTLTCLIFPHSSKIFMLHAFTAAHEEQHMNENIQREKKICRHMGTFQDTFSCAFYALSLLPPLDV